MEAPKKIYLQVCMECNHEDCENCKFEDLASSENVTWCQDRIFPNDVEYIRKDAVLDLLKAEKEKTSIGLCESDMEHENGRMEVVMSLFEKIKSL